MTVCQYSFKPLGRKRCYKSKCNVHKHHKKTQPGLPLSYPPWVHKAKCLVIWHQIVPTNELYLCCKCFYIVSQLVCTLWLVNSVGRFLSFFLPFFFFFFLSFFFFFFFFWVIDSSRKNLVYNLQYGPWLAREGIVYLNYTHPQSSSMQKYLD